LRVYEVKERGEKMKRADIAVDPTRHLIYVAFITPRNSLALLESPFTRVSVKEMGEWGTG